MPNTCRFHSLVIVVFASMLFHGVAHSQELKVGAVLQLTGPSSEYGVQVKRGALLAQEYVNKSAKFGDQKLQLIFEDGKGDSALSVSALQKLITLDKVPAFITQASSVTLALAPISNVHKVIQMDVGSITSAYRTPGDFTFRVAVTARQLAMAMADALIRMKYRTAAVLYVEDDYGINMLETFRPRFLGSGGSLVQEEGFLPSNTDYRSQLLKLKKARPAALALIARYGEMGSILKQLHQAKLNVPAIGDVYGVQSEEMLRAAGAQAAEGVLYVAPAFDLEANEAARWFREHYEADYDEQPVQLSAQGFDGVLALANAFKGCKEMEVECARRALEGLSLDGAAGKIEFDETGDVKNRATVIKRVRDGKFEVFLPDEFPLTRR